MVSFIYPIVVVVTVLLSSIALGYLLIKHNMLNLQVFLSITISTIAISIAFPQVCGIVIEISSNLPFLTVLLPVVFILVYLSMVFLFTIVISLVISEKRAKALTDKIANSAFINSVKALIEKVSASRNNVQSAKNDYISETQTDVDTENKKIGQEIAEMIMEQTAVAEMETAGQPESTIDGEAEEGLVQLGDESAGDDIQGKNILEKSVDSEENIDTMCIESIIDDTTNIVENSDSFDIPVGVKNEYENGARPDAFDFIVNNEITAQKAEQALTIENDEISESDIELLDVEETNIDAMADSSTEHAGIEQSVVEESIIEDSTIEEAIEKDAEIAEYVAQEHAIEEAEDVESIVEAVEITEAAESTAEEVEITEDVESTVEEVEITEAAESTIEATEIAEAAGSIVEKAEVIEGVESTAEVAEITEAVEDATEEESVAVGAAEEIEIAERAAEEFIIEETVTDEEPASYTEPETKDIEYFVDMAFRFKEQGNFEESIQNYMYALEQQPDKDLVFWIVLDMCVLYKNIGQAELAKYILESYVSSYGNIMDAAVKAEIEKNL